jgi:lipopolysaccharide transport system ATP-binding protein
MSDVLIQAEGLGKKYIIGHQAQRERYTALRDVLARGAKTFLRKASDLAHGRAVIEGDELEEVWALRDVSFEVKRGEVLGIIGRNGAGKSTLLKILSRITEPTTGRVLLRGRVASLLEVGTGFHLELSGRENIFLNGAILGMSRAEIRSRFDEIVAFAEVEKFLDTPVKRYSSGMYVRLAFAVAAHLEPEILIVDEVLAVGDIAFQKRCIGKMQDVARGEGRTVLFVSHNLAIIRQLCGRSILLEEGRLATTGITSEVLTAYARGLGTAGPLRVPAPSCEQRDCVYVSALWLESALGAHLAVARVGESWRVRIRLLAARTVPQFVIALSALTSEGVAVQTCWSPPQDLAAGEHEVVFTQSSVALAADSYKLAVGISEAGKSVQQFEAARLEITGEDPLIPCAAASGYGLVLNSMNLTMVRL